MWWSEVLRGTSKQKSVQEQAEERQIETDAHKSTWLNCSPLWKSMFICI